MPFSFPKTHRLRTKSEFQGAFVQPAKVSHRCFVALFTLKDQPQPRLGLIVGKRVAKQAVARNLIKRVVRESFRAHQRGLPNANILIIARPECNLLDKKSLRTTIDELWPKLIASLPRS